MALPLFIVDKPHLPPHLCMRCRVQGEIREYFLDTGIDTEYDGRIYLCNLCLQDFAKIDPNAFTRSEVNDIVATSQEQLAHADRVAKDYKEKFDYLLTVGINLDNVITNLKEADNVRANRRTNGCSTSVEARDVHEFYREFSDVAVSTDSVPTGVVVEQSDATGTIESTDPIAAEPESNSNPLIFPGFKFGG